MTIYFLFFVFLKYIYYAYFSVSACNHDIIAKSSESLQISSPLYPDTYPLFANCHWNVTVPNGSIVHLAFQNLNLAKDHFIKISQIKEAPNVFEGNTLPSDLFLKGNVLVDFDSSDSNKSAVSRSLNSDSGFLLNVTVAGKLLIFYSFEFQMKHY